MGILREGSAAGQESETDRAGARRSILIVDDEDEVRTVLRLALTRAGYEVREAESGETALLRIQEERPDLVLLDVMMPGMDGFAVCRRLRAEVATADLPVVILSARTDARSRQAGRDAGATRYLTKPLSPEQLILQVGDTLRSASGPAQTAEEEE